MWPRFISYVSPAHRGSRCYFPVFVKGANLSVGDLHFSQGDVSCAAKRVTGTCFLRRSFRESYHSVEQSKWSENLCPLRG